MTLPSPAPGETAGARREASTPAGLAATGRRGSEARVTILVVGYNAWDVLVAAPACLPRDAKVEAAQIVMSGGGPAATAACALARLGADVRLVTPLADDLPGRMQRQDLQAAGVDCSLSPARPDCESPRAVILVAPGGERTILWRRGALPPLAPAEVRPQWGGGVELLLCDSHEPAAAAVLAAVARARGVPVVLDGGTARTGMAALVPLCTDVVSSSVFAPALTGCDGAGDALRALAGLGPERVAMTMGAAGCLALDDGVLVHVPAFRVDVVDTTGAGDAFHAGYALARARGLPWLACLEYGSAVAALACRGLGGRRSLPTSAEVAALIGTGERRSERPSLLD
jgi:sugar/nucleoside kinase (ribokinase family)